MAEIYPSLIRHIVPRIGQEPSSPGGLREWLLRGTYAAVQDTNSGVILLQNIAPQNLLSYLSHDYERFAFASWESFRSFSLESSSLSLVSWPMLKLYYSAFFAAHATMRATGMSIVKIERAQTELLNQVIAATSGKSPGLKPGMYQARLRQIQLGQLEVVLAPHIEGSGVHDGFWKSFTDYLESLAEDAVEKQLIDASAFVAGVNDMSPRTRGWLSARRNDINYQQLFGVWYPLIKGKSLNDRIRSIKLQASKSVNMTDSLIPPINAFLSTCQFLACLNNELGEYIAARSSSANAFGTRWRKFNSILDNVAA